MQPLHRFFTPTVAVVQLHAVKLNHGGSPHTLQADRSRDTRGHTCSRRGWGTRGSAPERTPAACIASAMRWTSSGRPSRRTLTMTTSLENLRRPSRRSLRLRLQKSPKKSSLCSSGMPSRRRTRTRYIIARPLENIFRQPPRRPRAAGLPPRTVMAIAGADVAEATAAASAWGRGASAQSGAARACAARGPRPRASPARRRASCALRPAPRPCEAGPTASPRCRRSAAA